MLSTVSSSIFKNSESIDLIPAVSAEWNHNLFNSPYITVAGTGAKQTISASATYADAISPKENFITKSFQMSGGTGSAEYTVSGLSGAAYKVITYVKTNSPTPVMISTYAKGSDSQLLC